MKLKKSQVNAAVVALRALTGYTIKDLAATVKLARNLRRLKAIVADYEEDRQEMVKAYFKGEKFDTEDQAAKHPEYERYQEAAKKLGEEEVAIGEILKIATNDLATTKDKPAVPAEIIDSIGFMLSDYEPESNPAAVGHEND